MKESATFKLQGSPEEEWDNSLIVLLDHRNHYTYVYRILVVLNYLMVLMGVLKTQCFDSAGVEAEPFPAVSSNLFP